MVFSSLPAYLDPANWQQQINHHHLHQPHPHQQHGASSGVNTHLLPPPPPPPPAPHGSGGAGSIRPGSMADRARMANIPMPELALRCPRCDSTNTKFCYFNNYSLSQPRHFCKTCRRYWTRGGALRNVPVGGGCRRNKRIKGGGSSSKSPVSSDRPAGSGSSSTVSCNSGGSDMLGLGPQIPPLRFMAPLHHHLNEFADIGLNYGALSAPVGGTTDHLNFQIGSTLASAAGLGGSGGGGGSGSGSGGGIVGGSSLLSMGGLEQWRLQQGQQFPFLGGLDSSSSGGGAGGGGGGLYHPFEGGNEPSGYGGQVRSKFSSSLASQFASVKMEDSQGLNLSRQFLGSVNNQGNDPYWSGNAWTDLSNFSSSSTTNQL